MTATRFRHCRRSAVRAAARGSSWVFSSDERKGGPRRKHSDCGGRSQAPRPWTYESRLRKQAGGCPTPLLPPIPLASSGSAQRLVVVQRGQPGDLSAVLPCREARFAELLQIEPEFA